MTAVLSHSAHARDDGPFKAQDRSRIVLAKGLEPFKFVDNFFRHSLPFGNEIIRFHFRFINFAMEGRFHGLCKKMPQFVHLICFHGQARCLGMAAKLDQGGAAGFQGMIKMDRRNTAA